MFVVYLCNFNIAENVNIVGISFLHKCKYLQRFQFKDLQISDLFPNHFSRKRLDYSPLAKNDQ